MNNYYKNPKKHKIKREKQKLKAYGLTIESYNLLLKNQGGVCKICEHICKTGRKLSVDHCHKTNKVRGLLCTNCNQGLGKFKDDKRLLNNAVNYLHATGIIG